MQMQEKHNQQEFLTPPTPKLILSKKRSSFWDKIALIVIFFLMFIPFVSGIVIEAKYSSLSHSHGPSITAPRKLLVQTLSNRRQSPAVHGDPRLGRLLRSGSDDHSRILMDEPPKQSPAAHGDPRHRRLLRSGSDDHSRILMDEPPKQSPAAHGDPRLGRLLRSDDHSRLLMDEPPKQSPAAHGDPRLE